MSFLLITYFIEYTTSFQNSKMYVNSQYSSNSTMLSCCGTFSILPNFFGCVSSAPNMSSPRGCSQVFALGCRLDLLFHRVHNFHLSCILSRVWIILSIRVAPEPMIGCLHLDVGSKIHTLYCFTNSKIFFASDVNADQGDVLSTH
jgi:hypothetical protein